MKNQRNISNELFFRTYQLQYQIKQDLIQISKKICNEILVIKMFLCDKGIAIPQTNFGLFSGLEIIGLAFFWLLFSTVWLFIEIVIWQPCYLLRAET